MLIPGYGWFFNVAWQSYIFAATFGYVFDTGGGAEFHLYDTNWLSGRWRRPRLVRIQVLCARRAHTVGRAFEEHRGHPRRRFDYFSLPLSFLHVGNASSSRCQIVAMLLRW